MEEKLKFAIIGADGQLGSDLQQILRDKNEEFIPLLHSQVEILDKEKTLETLRKISPDVIINTAAFHRVDDCESDYVKAFNVNATGALNMALCAKELGALYVFISTDYVFSGKKGKPYTEDDIPDPVNIYGISKRAGELAIQCSYPRHIIARSSGLYGEKESKKGWNFVDRMQMLAIEKGVLRVVDDQVLSPTYTMDLAEKIYEVIKKGGTGIYHITNSGQCSWYQLTKKILELTGIKCDLSPVTTGEFKTPAKRPAFSVLENKRLKDEGFTPLRHWESALEDYLRRKGKLK